MDVVVTVPKGLWSAWLEEGDLVGDAPTGEEWAFWLGSQAPDIAPGERVYIVAHGRLRGFSPLTRRVVHNGRVGLCRRAGAEAVTIPEVVRGFQGYRYRWWDQGLEVPFPDWRTAAVPR